MKPRTVKNAYGRSKVMQQLRLKCYLFRSSIEYLKIAVRVGVLQRVYLKIMDNYQIEFNYVNWHL